MRKTKEIAEKLLSPRTAISAQDLTADEKKELYDLLGQYGMAQSTAYLRIFDKGFDEWEIRGIDDIKKEFIADNDIPHLSGVGKEFYSSLPFMSGLKVKLVNLMAELGMEHRNTVNKRFDADDWMPWERHGIRAILHELPEE